MIGYVTVGTNNIDAAVEFYDALFGCVNIKRLWKHGNMAAWGRARSEPAFCVAIPENGNVATAGNGAMVALRMAKPEEVVALHAKCLELGGTSEGSPGTRGDHGFYGGYFRDLEGNKLNAYIPG